MAKKTKDASSSNLTWASFGFTFVGSIIFLWLAFMASGFLLNGSTSLWQPLLYAGAVVGSIVLFITNFGNVVASGHKVSGVLLKSAALAGFSLVALSAGSASSTFFGLAIVGLVLSFIGAALVRYGPCDCECRM